MHHQQHVLARREGAADGAAHGCDVGREGRGRGYGADGGEGDGEDGVAGCFEEGNQQGEGLGTLPAARDEDDAWAGGGGEGDGGVWVAVVVVVVFARGSAAAAECCWHLLERIGRE